MSTPRVSEYRLRRRVNFYEVDQAGIVHFSWYFRYFEEAEHARWRSAGLTIAARDAAIGFPRVAAAFDYRKPLHFEDEFEVVVRISAIGRTSITYSCVITRGETTVANGSTTIVCVTKGPGGTMTATPIPPDIADRVEAAAGVPA